MNQKNGRNTGAGIQWFSMPSLTGRWYFEAVEIPAVGIRREPSEHNDYFFDFRKDGSAVVHIHGDTYETEYTVRDGSLTFRHAKLAALKLTPDGEKLKIMNYLGTRMIFARKCSVE